jgi:CHAD domain-containing protein
MILDGDAEALHQMRVALRRLRAAISLFSVMLRDPQTHALQAEFKWITGELGPARELDVFLKRVAAPIADRNPHGPEVIVLVRELEQQREEAFARARAAVDSPRFRNLVLDTAAWIEAGDWTHNLNKRVRGFRDCPIAAAAAEQLRRRWKAILQKGERMDALDPHRRHKLRIKVKKLRYAAEFFAGVFTRKKATRRREDFVASLEKLQDALGDLNDIAVHEQLSERLADSADTRKRHGAEAKKAFAAGRLSGREEARLAPVLAQAQQAYAAFAEAKPFWA